MATESSLIDSALRAWKSNVERADKLFEALSPGELEQEVAPGKNRLIYLWGHLAAVNDALLPLLGIGERLAHCCKNRACLQQSQPDPSTSQSSRGKRNDSAGISEIKFKCRIESRKE